MRHGLSCLLALFAAHGAAAITPDDFVSTFPIETGAASAPAWRVELTPEASAWLQGDSLRDVAVFDANGQPVPSALAETRAPSVTRERRIALPLLALPATVARSDDDLRLVIERDDAGRLRRLDAGAPVAAPSARVNEWLIDAGSVPQPIDGFRLDWNAPAAGVSARFSVAASDDLHHWRPLGEAGVVSLQQGDLRIDRRDLDVAPARAAYFRLHRLDDGVALEHLSVQARVVDSTQREPGRQWLVANAQRIEAPDGTAAFEYALPAALPIDRARIELAGDNAVRALILSVPAGEAKSPPRVLAHVDAYRLRVGNEVLQNDDLVLATARERRFRLESRTPLADPPTLALGYRPDALVFLAEGPAPYALAVGSRAARRPDYPLAAALATLRGRFGNDWQPPLATLGKGQPAGGNAVLEPPPAPLPWRQWLLWGVLVGGAALVGGLALSLLRERKP